MAGAMVAGVAMAAAEETLAAVVARLLAKEGAAQLVAEVKAVLRLMCLTHTSMAAARMAAPTAQRAWGVPTASPAH
jgi:hypothetical protein